MPHKLLTIINDMRGIKLEDFFGFCLAEVSSPKNIKMPLLPYKFKGKTIFPLGTWTPKGGVFTLVKNLKKL